MKIWFSIIIIFNAFLREFILKPQLFVFFYPQFCLIKIITKVLNWVLKVFIVRFEDWRGINNLEVYSFSRKSFVSLKVRCWWMTEDLRGRLQTCDEDSKSWYLIWKFYWKLHLNFSLIVIYNYNKWNSFEKHNLFHGIIHLKSWSCNL